MEKSDGKSTSGRTEKQFAVYRRNRKRIGVKSATGRGTMTYHLWMEVDRKWKQEDVTYIHESPPPCRWMVTV